MQEKIMDLETKYSFQEDLLQSLNDEVARQARQIQAMVQKIALIEDQISDLAVRDTKQSGGSSLDERPPHY